MPYSYSDTIPDISVKEKIPQNALIEMYVWDAFTVKRTLSNASYLAKHSFDRAPVILENLPIGRTCYRFTEQEWIGYIKPYLIEHWIPVTIRMISLAALAELHSVSCKT